MCLTINTRRHLYSGSFPCTEYVPLVAKKPFIVYKILNSIKDGLQTPFQKTHIDFISGNAVLEAPMMDHYQNSLYVNIGIHAFEKRVTAEYSLKVWSCSDTTLNLAIYEAIIPAGTKYFCGLNDAIVSEKLIIKNKIVE